MCYKSLVLGKNSNVKRVRDVRANLEGCHDTGHGSVFEHCQLNFIVTNCSRVYTHEQVRHRTGWAYSQTSGRYCRLDSIDLVWSDLLDPVKDLWLAHLEKTEDLVYLTECRLGLRKPSAAKPTEPPERYMDVRDVYDASAAEEFKWVPDDSFDFDRRKAITSAIRRIAPNGQANEIGMSCNIRALRQVVQVRTQRFAETEIRDVYAQVYHLVAAEFPTIFYKARTRLVDGLPEVYGMKMNPFDLSADDPKSLFYFPTSALKGEIDRRTRNGIPEEGGE
jgi:thymidylate synthase (FAD)